MALHTLTEDGFLGWRCVECGASNEVDVSHEGVQYCLPPGAPIQRRTVRLPACGCGAQTFLKVDFTAKELAAPNMIDGDGNPTPSRAVAERHMQLVQQMDAAGKTLPPPPPPQIIKTFDITIDGEESHGVILGDSRDSTNPADYGLPPEAVIHIATPVSLGGVP